jgi:hypothetical protein
MFCPQDTFDSGKGLTRTWKRMNSMILCSPSPGTWYPEYTMRNFCHSGSVASLWRTKNFKCWCNLAIKGVPGVMQLELKRPAFGSSSPRRLAFASACAQRRQGPGTEGRLTHYLKSLFYTYNWSRGPSCLYPFHAVWELKTFGHRMRHTRVMVTPLQGILLSCIFESAAGSSLRAARPLHSNLAVFAVTGSICEHWDGTTNVGKRTELLKSAPSIAMKSTF